MTSPIGGISFPSAVTGLAGVTGTAAPPDAVAQTTAAGDNGFASVLVSSLEELQAKQATSDGLAVGRADRVDVGDVVRDGVHPPAVDRQAGPGDVEVVEHVMPS